jgi:hypothetical protein
MDRQAHKGLAMTRRESEPRDDKREGTVRLVRASGSPRPLGARDDKRELRDGAVRLLKVSGSPRAFGPRDDNNWRKGTVRAYFPLFSLQPSIF